MSILTLSRLDNKEVSGRVEPMEILKPISVDQPIPASIQARKVIIIYSHADRQWLDVLKTQLALLERQQMIELWDDTRIAAGAHWEQTTSDALNTANIALLLVSANFLASDFIMCHELPQILRRHAQGQLAMLSLILSPCLYNESPLGKYQSFNPAEKTLSELVSSQVDEILLRWPERFRSFPVVFESMIVEKLLA